MHQHEDIGILPGGQEIGGHLRRTGANTLLHKDNNEADELVKMRSRWAPVLTGVFIQQLH